MNKNKFPYNWIPRGSTMMKLKDLLIKLLEGQAGSSSGISNIKVGDSNLPVNDGSVTLGTASLLDSGTSSGNVVVLDSEGLIPSQVLPSISISDTYICSDDSVTTVELLIEWCNGQASVPEKGDIIVLNNSSDISGSYVVTDSSSGSVYAVTKISTPGSGISSIEINGTKYNPVDGVVSIDGIVKSIEVNGQVWDPYVDGRVTLPNIVQYSTVGDRNYIQLKNYDAISSITTSGEGVNLIMCSKWDVVDVGSTKTHLNLATSEVVTVNDNKLVITNDRLLAGDNVEVVTSVEDKTVTISSKIPNELLERISSLESQVSELKTQLAEVKSITDQMEIV